MIYGPDRVLRFVSHVLCACCTDPNTLALIVSIALRDVHRLSAIVCDRYGTVELHQLYVPILYRQPYSLTVLVPE